MRLSRYARVLALAIAIVCITPLVVALFLEPSPTGVGTHQALGLAPCNLERRFGIPCPTCGMTTSFALFVRARILASLYVQPMGAVLAFACCMVFWVAMYEFITGRAVHRLLRIAPAGYYLWTAFGMLIAAWAWKTVIHVLGLGGPGR